jgi:FkbM family methyltransferase
MNNSTPIWLSLFALYLRRIPWESARWRFIPYALRQSRSLIPPDTYRTFRTRYGFRMKVDIGEWLGRHLYVTGEYEPATSRLIHSLLQPGGVFVDVGANAGYFSLLAAARVGQHGKVIALEPLPLLRERLEMNMGLNQYSWYSVRSEAASDLAGEFDFFEGPADHLGTSSLRHVKGSSARRTVRTERLDILLQTESQVTLIKIDVEGAECHVLEGARQTLTRHRPDVVVELTDEYLRSMGRSARDLVQYFEELGYSGFAIHDDRLAPLAECDVTQGQFNVYFTLKHSGR